MRTKLILCAAALLLCTATKAQAGMITLTASDIIDPPGNTNTPPDPDEEDILLELDSSIHAYYRDLTDIGDELYKNNVGGSEEKTLAGSYEITNFSASGGTLKYSGSGNILDPTMDIFFIVKDGNVGYVIYDLGPNGPQGVGWDGMMDIVFTNVGLPGPNNTLKDISNVQLWGSSTEPPDEGPGLAPEPSSWALMAIGMLGLGGYGWRKRRMLAA